MKVSILSYLFILGASASVLPVDPAAADVDANTTALFARQASTLNEFSFGVSRSFNSGLCFFKIKTWLHEDDNVWIPCNAGYDGTTIISPTNHAVFYRMRCNINGGGPNGQNECAVRRQVCTVIPVLGQKCATVEMGQSSTTLCPNKRGLGARQDMPQGCSISRGKGLPKVMNWT